MTTFQSIELLEIFASIGFFVWLFYGPWSSFVIDLARQNLFEIRDSVFSLAADGKIGFEDKTYHAFRGRINHMIRFCHHFSLSNLFASALVNDTKSVQIAKSEVLEMIRAIPNPEVARQLERQYIQAVTVLVLSLGLRSAFILVTSMLLLPLIIIYEMLRGAKASEKILRTVNNAVERDLALEESAAIA